MRCAPCRDRKRAVFNLIVDSNWRSVSTQRRGCPATSVGLETSRNRASNSGVQTPKLRSLSRRMTAGADPAIRGEDMLLLQYAYFGTDLIYRRIFRKFSVIYGETISDTLLRSAILLDAATNLSASDNERQIEFHRGEAHRELIRKLNNPSKISFSDVFASFLLSKWQDQGRIHFNGCISMIKYLLHNTAGSSMNEVSCSTLCLIADLYAVTSILDDLKLRGEMLELRQQIKVAANWCRLSFLNLADLLLADSELEIHGLSETPTLNFLQAQLPEYLKLCTILENPADL